MVVTTALKWVVLPHFNQEEAGAQKGEVASGPAATKGTLVSLSLHMAPSRFFFLKPSPLVQMSNPVAIVTSPTSD